MLEVDGLNVSAIREDFPILRRKINGMPLAFLDNAATSQKPRHVLEAIRDFYFEHNSNVLRSANTLSFEATELYINSRRKIASFIGAEEEEVVFTKGATDSLNCLAQALADRYSRRGVRVVTSILEHHSNLLPWKKVAKKNGWEVVVVRADHDWKVDIERLEEELERGAELVAVTHVSNVLGTVNDVKEIADRAHNHGALIVVDSAQGVPHMPVSVADMGVDFLAFSGHKMLGPTGVGVLFGKKELLRSLEPWQWGGGMVKSVEPGGESLEDLPYRFEAGTPDIAGVVGLGAAVDYLQALGMMSVRKHEQDLVKHAFEVLEGEDIDIYGPRDPNEVCGIVSFNIRGVHPHDVAHFLDQDGVMIRAGHHCAQPLVNSLGVNAVARASFYVYNTPDEVERLAASVKRAREVLS